MVAADTRSPVTRRGFLRGAPAAATIAGAATGAAAQEAEGDVFTVDMTDDLVYVPEDATVAPGTTVVWENVGEIPHTVTAYEEEVPPEAEYFASGGFEGEEAARAAYPAEGVIEGGASYRHTFEVEGEYQYFCIPHESAGMIASLTVTTEQAEAPDVPSLPAVAATIAVAATTALVVVVAFAFFFLKYGGDYGEE